MDIIIIEPKKSWFSLGWKDLWGYRDLIAIFIRRDIVATYKQTVLGPLWFFISPILTTLIFTFVFSNVARIGTSNIPPILFYLSGLTLWNYFSTCFTGTANTFVANSAVFGKVYFPRLVIPISLVISNLVKFGIQLLVLVTAIVYYSIKKDFEWQLGPSILALPIIVVLMALLSLGGGILISSLTTKYRDLSILVSFGIGLLMYVTPVIYPMESIPEKIRWIVSLNPISPLIDSFRAAALGQGQLDWAGLGYSAAATAVLLIIGSLLFNRVEKTFMDTV